MLCYVVNRIYTETAVGCAYHGTPNLLRLAQYSLRPPECTGLPYPQITTFTRATRKEAALGVRPVWFCYPGAEPRRICFA